MNARLTKIQKGSYWAGPMAIGCIVVAMGAMSLFAATEAMAIVARLTLVLVGLGMITASWAVRSSHSAGRDRDRSERLWRNVAIMLFVCAIAVSTTGLLAAALGFLG